MTIQEAKPRAFHPAAVVIFFLGITALIVGMLRVHLGGSMGTVQPGGAPTAHAREPGPLRLVVSLPPLLWPAKGLAPANTEFTLLTPPGSGCEGVEITPAQAAAIARADLVIRAGAHLDDSLARHPARRPWQREVTMSDPAGREEQAAAPVDQHPWLDPILMEQFVSRLDAAIQSCIEDIDAGERAALRGSAAELQRTCRVIDAEYRDRLAAFKGMSIVTHHDAWTHLAERYGLHVAAVIQHTHDAEPSPGDLADAANVIKEGSIRAVFIEPQLNPASAQRIAETTGAKVLVLDPLGHGDWPTMMRNNLDALVEGLATTN
ncbi:MAG: zinc ABC transporter substrate-binding protein [Phycisphaerae bacterium]|nr:zinc ABC transporter substrate-binding protein [Phycisphaerae bacterium]